MVAALLTAPYLPGSSAIAIIAAAGAVGVIRVRQGAHFPLDVAGGTLLGASVGWALRAAVGASYAASLGGAVSAR
jgi:membrane-associated phospholipid phosphatase